MAEAPPLTARLVWTDAHRFDATSARTAAIIDGDSTAGPSPMQHLAFALAGCMAIDTLDIVRRGRHPLTGLTVAFTASRAPDPPRRLTAVHLRFEVAGDVPAHVVERALMLSREKYCSVWHSLRTDIALTTECEIRP